MTVTGCSIRRCAARLKGGIRFHPNVDMQEVKALAAWMSIKCRIADIPYGRRQGRRVCGCTAAFRRRAGALDPRYTARIAPIIGEDTDIPAPDVNTNGQIMAGLWILILK